MIKKYWIFVFVISGYVFDGCSKEKIGGGTFNPEYTSGYIIADGDTLFINSTMPGFISEAAVNKVIDTPPDSSFAIYTSQLYDSVSLHPGLIIKKGTLRFIDSIPTDAQFISFFTSGVQDWSVNALNGVEVIYVDPQGTVWSTSEAGGYQGTQTFTITEAASFMENGVRCVRIKAVFNCTLYHPAYQPIQGVHGTYIGLFRNL